MAERNRDYHADGGMFPPAEKRGGWGTLESRNDGQNPTSRKSGEAWGARPLLALALTLALPAMTVTNITEAHLRFGV